MTASGSIPPPPGWHPDPWDQRVWRWWDGSRWTGHVSDPAAPVAVAGGPWVHPAALVAVAGGPWVPTASPWSYPPGAPSGWPVPSAHDALAAEVAMAPWAKRGFAWYVVVVIAGLVLAWAESSSFRHVFHELRIEFSTGRTQPQANRSVWKTDLLSVVTLVVSAPFYVLVLVWQYRAATTARRLNLPAARSPGLGVGGWFIPVVSFWFPYQALRDCLPPEDPDRRMVKRMWACFISVLIVNVVTEVVAWSGSPVGFAFAALALALGAGFAFYGVRTVRSITAAHRRLLGMDEAAALPE